MPPPPLPQQRSPFVRTALGIWNGLNFIRKLVLNLMFFGLLLLLLVAIAAGQRGALAPLHERTTLIIAPQGELVEQFRTDAFSRALLESMGESTPEVQLRDLMRVLEAAKDDDRIERVVLRTDGLVVSGYATLRELATPLAELRATGKQVIAFGESFDQAQYLLAAQADEIYLDPEGMVDISGLHRYRQYFRETLQDKLGVDVHLFKVGEYKSAAEPYILDAASPESKEADLYWMNDLWQRWLEDVSERRHLDRDALLAGIESRVEGVIETDGDTAIFAVNEHLVDGLKTREDLNALLAERGVPDSDDDAGYRRIGFDEYLAHLDAAQPLHDPRPQIAVVVAEGAISAGEQPPGQVGGVSTSALLRSARKDDDIKAVVLRVNSPGGEVFASEQIRREIQALKHAGKPVVVSFANVAASGGYWISMNADRIYADESTITGSIGIFGLIPTIPRTLERIGMHTDGVSTTGAATFDPTRPLSADMGRLVQAVIDKGYRDFTGKVAAARGRSVADIDAVARGRVWSGAQAKARGLVDAFGGLNAAIADAAERAELDDWQVRYVEREPPPFERWLGQFIQSRLARAWLGGEGNFTHALVSRFVPKAAHELQQLEAVMTPTPGKPVKALAYCFCEL